MPRVRERTRQRFRNAGTTIVYDFDVPGKVASVYTHPPILVDRWETTDVVGKTKRRPKRLLSLESYAEDGLTPVSAFSSMHLSRKRLSWVSGQNRFNARNDVSPVSLINPTYTLPLYIDDEVMSRYAREIWAKTNPYRYEVSAFVTASELVEVASLFKLAMGSFLRMVAGAHLNEKFGWIPFLADLRALSTITKTVEKRALQLESMARQGGLRASTHLGGKVTIDTMDPDYPGAESTVNTWYGPLVFKGRYRITGTCRWAYRGGPPVIDKIKAFNVALTKVLDLELPDPATVWETVPFSWLVDYFLDIGTWLKARDGFLEIYPFDTCIVFRGNSSVSWSPTRRTNTGNSDFSCTGYQASRTEVKRFIVPEYMRNSFPTISTSWISPGQAENMSALIVLLLSKLRSR